MILNVAPGTKVYLACRPVDMRKGFDGLAALVATVLKKDPYCGHVFLFRGKHTAPLCDFRSTKCEHE